MDEVGGAGAGSVSLAAMAVPAPTLNAAAATSPTATRRQQHHQDDEQDLLHDMTKVATYEAAIGAGRGDVATSRVDVDELDHDPD
jgi:hypothetical protein